jgi:AraC-like DNA-binding protein
MQTSMAVAGNPFRSIEQDVAASLLSRDFARLNATAPSPSSITCLAFGKRPKNRGLAATEKMEETISYMTQNLNRPLQVSTLAALVNVSPSHYFALFKRHTGRAPIDYFTRLRMEKARCLLDTTASSVKEVAALLGYDDPFYFSRVFKSVNQVAPSNYRMLRRVGEQNNGNNGGEDSPCDS